MKKSVFLAAAALVGALTMGGCAQTNAAVTAAAGTAAAAAAETAASAAAPGVTTVVINQNEEETVTVSASASLPVEPDRAEISLGVVNNGATAAEVQALNSEQIDEVVNKLKELGVEEKSIQTTEFYMYPNYDYSEGVETITGYTANTYLKITDLPIDQAGKVISESIKTGINSVNSLRYFSSRYDEVYQTALEKALEAARVKAEGLAKKAGGELDTLPTIREGYQDTAYRYDNSVSAAKEIAAEGDAGMTLNPGSLDVTAQVTVTYKVHLSDMDAEAE